MTCDFQQCGILTSVDLNEPVQPPFKLRNLKGGSVSKQPAKALISLPVCAGWSEPLLVTHTKLFEISFHGSYEIVQFVFLRVNVYLSLKIVLS